MPLYIVYNRKTGEPVLSHYAPESMKITRNDVLALITSSFEPESLDVVLVDPDAIREGEAVRIDPQTRGKEVVYQADASGFGLGAGILLNQELPKRPLKVVYETEQLTEND